MLTLKLKQVVPTKISQHIYSLAESNLDLLEKSEKREMTSAGALELRITLLDIFSSETLY